MKIEFELVLCPGLSVRRVNICVGALGVAASYSLNEQCKETFIII